MRLILHLRIYPNPFPFASWRLGVLAVEVCIPKVFHVDQFPGSACAQR